MTADEILLITRIRTLNKGNQALSAAWLQVLRTAFPTAPLRVLERRPRHLLQYTLARFARERDPFRAFDRATTALARLAPGADAIGPPAMPPPRIELDETISHGQRLVGLRQRLNLRGYAARAGLYRAEYVQRLAACQRARMVVVNPAGEFFPRDPGPALYHLLDAHVAVKLGRPTAMVNHTMDITDPTLRALIPPIYRDLSLVGFRDDKSVAAFRAMGGDAKNVLVTPDLALTTKPAPHARARRPGTIALAINVPEATAHAYAAHWITLAQRLVDLGFKIVLVSNELPADLPFYEQLRARVPLPIEGQGLDHDAYAALLGEFDFVISSRLHTGILAMIGGAPVLAVEGSSFKITGVFQELGLARPVIQPGTAGWTDRVVDQAVALRDHRDAEARDTSAKIDAIQARITGALVPRLQEAAR